MLDSLGGPDRHTVRTENACGEAQSNRDAWKRAEYHGADISDGRSDVLPRRSLTFSIKPLSESSPVATPLSCGSPSASTARAPTANTAQSERSRDLGLVWEDMVTGMR